MFEGDNTLREVATDARDIARLNGLLDIYSSNDLSNLGNLHDIMRDRRSQYAFNPTHY